MCLAWRRPDPAENLNWNCVYCQLGLLMPLINTRSEYIPREVILAEIQAALARYLVGDIDHISFVGSGEPTLHSGLGWLIRAVKQITPIPVAVITNGVLLHRDVRDDLLPANIVMLMVSAGTPELYCRIHRPHPEATFTRLIEGVETFRDLFTGQLWVEVMLLHEVNDTEEALLALATVLCPGSSTGSGAHHLAHCPPAEGWVLPANQEGLLRGRGGARPHRARRAPLLQRRPCPRLRHARRSDCLTVTRHPMSEPQLTARRIAGRQPR